MDLPGLPRIGGGSIGGQTIGFPDLPMLARGGRVMSTGLAVVHAGETFSGVGRSLGTTINVSVQTTGLGATNAGDSAGGRQRPAGLRDPERADHRRPPVQRGLMPPWAPGDPWPSGTPGGAAAPAWGGYVRLWVQAGLAPGRTFRAGPDLADRLDGGNVMGGALGDSGGGGTTGERLWVDMSCDVTALEVHYGGTAAQGIFGKTDAATLTATLFDPRRQVRPAPAEGGVQLRGPVTAPAGRPRRGVRRGRRPRRWDLAALPAVHGDGGHVAGGLDRQPSGALRHAHRHR